MTIAIVIAGASPVVLAGENTAAALAAASRAELAANSTAAAGRYFISQAAGEAGSTTGQFFSHPDGAGGLVYRERTAGGSTIIAYAATKSQVDTVTASLGAKAPLASPVFTGNPTAPTPTAGDNDTSIATTAFVTAALAGFSGGGVGFIEAESYGAVGNGTTSDTTAINNALAVGNVRLRPGVIYAVAGPVLIPSNRTLHLNGATIKMLAAFATAENINACVGANSKTDIRLLGPGTIDGNKVGLGGGDAVRKNGIMFRLCERFVVEGGWIIAKNCTGYIVYPTMSSRFTIRHVWTMNGSYHQEQMECNDYTVSDCVMTDGDGDISCGGWLHPVYNNNGCKRGTYRNCYGIGSASFPVYSLAGTSGAQAQSDLTFENIRFIATSGGVGAHFLGDGGAAHTGIRLRDCIFTTTTGDGLYAIKTELKATGCTFGGDNIGVRYAGACDLTFVECKISAAAPSGSAGFGIANEDAATGSVVRTVGGEINVNSNAGEYFTSGPGHKVSRETRLVSSVGDNSLDGQLRITASNNRWLNIWDANRSLIFDFTGENQTAFVYNDTVYPWPLGTRIEIINPFADAARSLTVSPETGTTINATGGLMKVKGYGRALLEKTGTSTWTLTGDLKA